MSNLIAQFVIAVSCKPTDFIERLSCDTLKASLRFETQHETTRRHNNDNHSIFSFAVCETHQENNRQQIQEAQPKNDSFVANAIRNVSSCQMGTHNDLLVVDSTRAMIGPSDDACKNQHFFWASKTTFVPCKQCQLILTKDSESAARTTNKFVTKTSNWVKHCSNTTKMLQQKNNAPQPSPMCECQDSAPLGSRPRRTL